MSFDSYYKNVQVGLSAEGGVAGKFSGSLGLDVKNSLLQVSEDASLSSNTEAEFTVFGDDLQLVRKITTIISIGGNTMQNEKEEIVGSVGVSELKTTEQLKNKAIDYMKDTYDPAPSEIPYPDRALFEHSACAFGKNYSKISF